MVKFRILAVATMCAILALATILPEYGAATTAFAAVTEIGPGFALPGSGAPSTQAGKVPSVASAGNTVYMVANSNETAQAWTKQDTASSASGPVVFGPTLDDTDYTEAATAAGPGGTVYAVWIAQRSGINMRRKPVGGDWEPTKPIYRTGSFMSHIDVAVTSTGQIFVVWNQASLYRYITSSDGGNNWTSERPVSSKTPYRFVSAAGGPNNSAVVAFGSNDGRAYASIWNGSSFDTVDLTPFKTSGDFFADAKPVIGPDGKIYVVFRNASGGLFYSERQSDGSWPVSKLAGGSIYGSIGAGVDAGNNIHFSWSSNATGSWQLYYAFKPANGDWQGPLRASAVTNKIITNVDLSTTIGARNFAHAIFETFDGSDAAIRYQQFSGEGAGGGPSAIPTLDGGATATRNSVVTVSFANIVGAPDGVRYHWDSPPTDADPWVAFANPLTVQAPAGITGDACQTHTLFTQVRKGTAAGSASQDALTFDTGVQADVNILNPHLAGLPSFFGLGARDVATGTDGASDGDPKYTREGSFFLGISGQADCSNLDTFYIPGSDTVTPRTIASNSYSGPAALPQGSTPGDHEISVDVTDKLGNKQTVEYTLTYDPINTDTTGTQTNTLGLPVLASGGSVTADDAKSIIRTLSFSGIDVTDNLYGKREDLPDGKQFWGVWIANATSDVGADSPALNWYPVRVGTPDSSFSVKWDLFSGLGFTSDLRNKSGDYFVYVRFLDGAGNPSQGSLKVQVTLEAGYDIPTVRLPALAR